MSRSIASAIILVFGCFSVGVAALLASPQHDGSTKKKHAGHPKVPPPQAKAAYVLPGYEVDVVVKNLTYPTSIDMDDEGNLYLAEAGYSYGDPTAIPRILRVTPTGGLTVVAQEGLNGPVNDLLWHDGRLFISHRGKISALEADGTIRDLVTGLPSWGDHQNNQMSIGPDGKLYFGQGTATNSGVVGLDNYKMGWLKKYPDFHDRPAKDLRIVGRTYKTRNPLTDRDGDVAITSSFHPFGKYTRDGEVIPGVTKANGTILRMNADGSALEVFAWGLRNPFGVAWSPDGKLYASENGYDVRGSRPIANARENLWLIKPGAWYGWPDFSSGIPVTDARFKPPDRPGPQFLMSEHPPVEKPVMTFAPHAAPTQMDFAPGKAFGSKGQLFLAFFGHMTPMTGNAPEKHGGHRVVRINLETREAETFFGRRGHHHGKGKHHQEGQGGKQAGHGEEKAGHEHKGGHHAEGGATAGPRRLMDVRFAPQGEALYVVDFGAMFVDQHGITPVPRTGVLWRITPTGTAARPPAGLVAPPVQSQEQD